MPHLLPHSALAKLAQGVERCARCPELRSYCREVARTKRKSYADEDYWGKPVPGFGDPNAAIWVLGLAPAAHGGNRTGRVFTGDRSGDFLFAGLHRAGLANQALARSRDDGLELGDVYVSAALRCAPPANKPTLTQLEACQDFLDAEWKLLTSAKVIFCLGGIAWLAALRIGARQGIDVGSPKPKFGHGAEVQLGPRAMIGCYHVSQQNTFTGRLTPKMLDEVLERAKTAAATGRASPTELPGTHRPARPEKLQPRGS